MNEPIQSLNTIQTSMPGSPDSGASCPLGGALLGAGAVLVWNDVAEQGRDQFYQWHDKEHIPEWLATTALRPFETTRSEKNF